MLFRYSEKFVSALSGVELIMILIMLWMMANRKNSLPFICENSDVTIQLRTSEGRKEGRKEYHGYIQNHIGLYIQYHTL